MDLSQILTISGKAGLFKIVSQTRSGLIAESMNDGRKIPVFATDRSSVLSDISLFTTTDDMPLKEVLKAIYEKENGGPCLSPSEDPEKLKAFFAEILPEYDRDRVYVSDMKKVLGWYLQLLEKNLLSFEEQEEPARDEDSEDTPSAQTPEGKKPEDNK